jgi:hypothetical protein
MPNFFLLLIPLALLGHSFLILIYFLYSMLSRIFILSRQKARQITPGLSLRWSSTKEDGPAVDFGEQQLL